MEKIVRPESMERITTPELAQKFIEEQVTEIRTQVGNKKVLLALSGGVFDKQRNVPGERQVIFWDSGENCYLCSRGHRFKSNGKLL